MVFYSILRQFALAALMLMASSVFALDWIYSARPGDNLWDISDRYLEPGTRYTERLRAHNNIADPYHISPGTPIRIPIEWLKLVPSSAVVLQVEGQATLTRNNQSTGYQPQPGEELRVGDSITTGSEGSVVIEFADGSRLLLQSNASANMDTLSAYEGTGMVDTQLRLRGGRVESSVTPDTGPGSRFEITTPAATAAVRGTKFRVSADTNDAATRAEVTKGSVVVLNSESKTALDTGFGIVAQADTPLGPPVQLLEAPDLSTTERLKESTVLAFSWPEVNRAIAYRAQLYSTDDVSRLIYDTVTPVASVEWQAPMDEEYRLNVRAIDTNNLEGLDASAIFVLNAVPIAPALLGPPQEAKLHGEPPQLWWSVPDGTTAFHLQVSRDASFENLLINQEATSQSRYTFAEEATPGQYYWRLASISAEGKGPFSKPAAFRVLAVPDAVADIQSEVAQDSIVFNWPPAANTEHYQFQMSDDESFASLLLDEQAPSNQIRVDLPAKHVIFFRARGISPEGVAGDFSAVNRVELPVDNDYRPILLLLPLLLLL